ncbi:hypothetical protein [Pantoea sp. CCBC3-3-1]|uniref:hypothetical protein n=1 Tax=Pantoea sp. CCBC3-3-1 TaxID=2490851 RepID=UPI0020C35D08|nr:hypothetical protein [Pantoea sp. CCBC3-3-1]
MYRLIAAGSLLVCTTFAAWGSDASLPLLNSKFQITCPGRPTMTVSNAQYGLTTVMWAGDHFQIASGTQQSKTDNGDKVSIVLFRNGDQMIVNKTDSETFFSYSGEKNLVSCNRTGERENSTVTLQRTDASGNVES